MRVLVIGANGKIGRLLLPLLADAGHDVRGMVRAAAQTRGVAERGAVPVVADLEGDFDHALDGCDAIVFTAGSGGQTGADRTALVDGLGAIRAADSARRAGVRRFIMISSRGADAPDRAPAIRHYLVAKAIADGYLQQSGLDHTILRPGRLSDDPATGRIRTGPGLGRGVVTREDVARTVVAALEMPGTIGKTFELLNNGSPIADALAAL